MIEPSLPAYALPALLQGTRGAQLPTMLGAESLAWGVVLVAIPASLLAVYLAIRIATVATNILSAAAGLVAGALGRVGLFVGRQVQDSLHLVGGILTSAGIAPLAVGNALIGRSRNAAHYARAFRGEALAAASSLYRLALGNPVWFLGLSPITEGLERRLPDLVSMAPSDGPPAWPGRATTGRTAEDRPTIEGYRINGELEPGGSGARLLLASPKAETLARYRAADLADPGQVVIKSFDLNAGSTVPQIVRESRSLEAARSLGLVLDHHLDDRSFWYVMPYVPGENLDVVTRRMHGESGAAGLDDRGLSRALGYACDLLSTLERFHSAGLWHKDIKPANLIVTEQRAQLVDLGLVTPLASAMTLTTHGTEYFRDPELVRMAMKGAKVQDIDGVKFDLYSVGAVLYSMIENSFPAHGSLSRISRRCPDTLAFIVRRAMADLSHRYHSAEEMQRDLAVMLNARNPWRVKPADLPSMSGEHERPGSQRARQVAAPPSPAPRPSLRRHDRDPAPIRKRGAFGWLSVAALFLLMLGGITVLLKTAKRQAAHHRVEIISSLGERMAAPSRGTPRDETRPGSHAGRRSGVHAEATLASLGRESRVLVLTSANLETNHPSVQSLRTVLLQRGHHLVGEGSGPDSIELVARAKTVAGLADVSHDGAAAQLQRFLNARQDVDALVWLGPGRGDEVSFRILTPDESLLLGSHR